MRYTGHSAPSRAVTPAAAYTTSREVASRSSSRPSVWSISPSVSTTAPIGVPRESWRGGHSTGCAASCARRSGDAFRRIQRAPSALTATDDCNEPTPRSRAARQLGQPQFHCGTPPPAAEPRMITRIETSKLKRGRVRHPAPLQQLCQPGSGVAGVSADFHPQLDDLKFGLRPSHFSSSQKRWWSADTNRLGS